MAEQARAVGVAGGPWALLVEAKGVQRYIFDSGPLRDLVGASDLVAGLAFSATVETGARDQPSVGTAADDADLIGKVIQAVGVTGDVRFSRRAAGAFCLHADSRGPLDRVRALFLLAASLRCPGLELSVAGPVSATDDMAALTAAYKAGSALRTNSAAALPPTGHPLTAFSPRTGRLTNALFRYAEGELQPGDGVTTAQRLRAQDLQGRLDGVARRYLGTPVEPSGRAYVFPRNLEATPDTIQNPSFPFNGDDRRIAVIHADLSGLGQAFRTITKHGETAEKVLKVSVAIEQAIEGAAQTATKTVLLDAAETRNAKGRSLADHPMGDGLAVIPARPVVLGGDDLTILVRADLALRFTQELLDQIELKTADHLRPFREHIPGLPDKLTACAGIAIVKAGQPFLMAHALAESLCKFAKKAAKAGGAPYASGLAFHNTQSTLREDYKDDILPRELSAPGAPDGPDRVLLTGNPYLLKKNGQHTGPLDHLMALVDALTAAPRGRGKLIEAGRALFEFPQKAVKHWERWREIVDDEQPGACAAVDQALAAFGIASPQSALTQAIGPINDALELIDLQRAVPKTNSKAAA